MQVCVILNLTFRTQELKVDLKNTLVKKSVTKILSVMVNVNHDSSPRSISLQKTVNGQPKITDLIDCSGSGDVDTSTIVDAREDGVIEGKTGRKLKVSLYR